MGREGDKDRGEGGRQAMLTFSAKEMGGSRGEAGVRIY